MARDRPATAGTRPSSKLVGMALPLIDPGPGFTADGPELLPLDAGEQYRFAFAMEACVGCHSCEAIAKSLGYQVRVDRCVVNICSRSRPSDNPRSGKKRPRFVRAYPNFNREEIEEWRRGVVNKCERIAHCIRTNEWVWSETACDNFYMRPCDFKKLDSSSPAAREVILLADFMEGRPWVPYQVSGEKHDDD